MKTTLTLAALALALCSLAPAQETRGERVVVPARNTTRPRKLNVHLMHGAITVKAYSGKEVIVEASGGRAPDNRPSTTADGLRRIDVPPRGIVVEEEDNQITVRTPLSRGGAVVISVPPDTALDLHTMQGEINVEGVHGEIAVDSMNGKVTLTNVSGNVLAHSMNGGLYATMDRVDAVKPLSFTTMNGVIDVTLPADYKGNVKLNTGHGGIYTDFDFKLGAGSITQQNSTMDGKFKVKIDSDRTMVGTINGGGAEATFKTYNGTIYIRKKK
jgi:hypothetical protein